MPVFTEELDQYNQKAMRKEKGIKDDDMSDDDDGSKNDEDELSYDENGEAKPLKHYPSDFSEDSEEEKEDFTIRKNDGIIVAATAENDFSNLEIYIYEQNSSSLYVHHEIMLSAYPLCMEWIPVIKDEESNKFHNVNLLAVGTFLPDIEIWDLDDHEAIEPNKLLGNRESYE